jgi:hypothetical protein
MAPLGIDILPAPHYIGGVREWVDSKQDYRHRERPSGASITNYTCAHE